MIDLYTAATPNGHKVSIALEELALPYTVHPIKLGAQEQKQPAFLAMNPNGRIPVIVDRDAGDFTLFESGAILIYLAERTGKLLPSEPQARMRTLQWLMFQMSAIGPMMGQANVFFRYFPEKIEPAIKRYQNECRRLFEVLETQLAHQDWIAGAEYTIADIATYPWVRIHDWGGISVDGLPGLQRWMATMAARPTVQRGLEVPPTRKETDEARAKSVETIVQR